MTQRAVRDETEASGSTIKAPSYGEVAFRSRTAAGETPLHTVYGWGRYQRQVSQLPPDQQRALIKVGEAIKQSFQPGRATVGTVLIEGHADYDTPRNLQRERQMSIERAQAVTNWLRHYVGLAILPQVSWQIRGLGATRPRLPPTTEANRSQNRRVEISLALNLVCPITVETDPVMVRWLRSSLNQVLRVRLPVTGALGVAERSALRSLQKQIGLRPTGLLDPLTRQAVATKSRAAPPRGFAPVFHPGVEHNHAPTGRWADVQSDARTRCGGLIQKINVLQLLSDPAKLRQLPLSNVTDCACALLSPDQVFFVAREVVMWGLPLAQKHLDHYRNGKGNDLVVDLENVIRADRKFRAKLAAQVKSKRRGHIRIEQSDYSVRDLVNALGAIDRLDFEVDRTCGLVHVWFKDRYEWHPVGFGYRRLPGDVRRPSNCVHAAMVELKSSGAADYWMIGSTALPLNIF